MSNLLQGHGNRDIYTEIRDGAMFKEINIVIMTIISVVARVYHEHGKTPFITGAWGESIYPVAGVHDRGLAIDYRTSNLSNPELIRVTINSALKDIDKGYRVLYHDTGSGFHFHVDWRPDTTFPI